MAVYLPIVTEFKSQGIEKAKKEFKNLEGFGAKAQYALKKAAIPAAAALAGVAAAMGDAVKGAIEDAAAQKELARTLEISTSANDAQIKSVEDWISVQGQVLGVADDELRPAFAKLARATYDIADAQKYATLAMDIAAATGKPLGTVTDAITKALGGQLSALKKLDPSLKGMIDDGASLSEVMDALGGTFGGAAQEAANTAEGGFKRLSLSLSETKESIGAALLPVVEKVLPILQRFADWAQKHPTAFLVIAGAITAVSVAIMAVNTAMALNPFSAIAAGVALLVVALVTAYKKFEWFRDGVKAVVNGVIGYFETLVNGWIMVVNGIIRAWNMVPGHKDIGTLGHVKLGRMGEEAPGGRLAVPAMAAGGIVTSPTMALIGEAGPEAVIPLDRLGAMGTNVTIHVNGGDPNAVVAALVKWSKANGTLPSQVKVA